MGRSNRARRFVLTLDLFNVSKYFREKLVRIRTFLPPSFPSSCPSLQTSSFSSDPERRGGPVRTHPFGSSWDSSLGPLVPTSWRAQWGRFLRGSHVDSTLITPYPLCPPCPRPSRAHSLTYPGYSRPTRPPPTSPDPGTPERRHPIQEASFLVSHQGVTPDSESFSTVVHVYLEVFVPVTVTGDRSGEGSRWCGRKGRPMSPGGRGRVRDYRGLRKRPVLRAKTGGRRVPFPRSYSVRKAHDMVGHPRRPKVSSVSRTENDLGDLGLGPGTEARARD